MLKVILHTKHSIFKKDVEWTYKPFLCLLGKGIVSSDGPEWRRQRTLLSSALRIDILEGIPAMAVRAVNRLCVKLDKLKQTGEVIEMAETFRNLTLQVIAEAVLSIPAEESDETFAKLYLPIVEEANLRVWRPERMYLPTPMWFKHRSDIQKLNDYVSGLIKSRWELRLQEAKEATKTTRKQDLLDKTLSAVKDGEWSGVVVNQIRDEIKTFILAGHETSASMLTWALKELSQNKEQLDKLRTEASSVYDDKEFKECPTRQQCEKLVYSECCLRESLRRYSVVPTVVRITGEDVKLGEYMVPKGTNIMVNIQGVHHNPSFWPEPLKYDPSRFLSDNDTVHACTTPINASDKTEVSAIKPYTFVPFLDGPRMCMGQYLSLLETKIVLSMLVHRYTFELVNPETASQTHGYMVPIIPGDGHRMKIH